MKQFLYTDAATCKTGLGVCAACQKPIASGQYRYRETAAAFINHHRACSESDPNWARIDAERAAAARKWSEYIADCDAFFAKWGHSDFSDWRDALDSVREGSVHQMEVAAE